MYLVAVEWATWGADVAVSDWLRVECKHRKKLPDWLKSALSQARRNAEADQLAVCVLHEHGRHDDILCMALSDFIDWFGSVSPVPAGGLHTVKTKAS